QPIPKCQTGRGERIRTSGPCLPKTVLYQAELLPDRRPRPNQLGSSGRGRGGPIGGRPRAGKRAFGVVAHPVMSSEKTHWEWQYLDLMRRIWDEGDERSDRTGIGTRSVFGPQLRFDLAGDRV